MSHSIRITDEISLELMEEKYFPGVIRMLNNRNIVDNLGPIPFPYTEQDARERVEFLEESIRTVGLHGWLIVKNGDAIGGISLKNSTGVTGWKDEIGYYLDEDQWGKGIMSTVLSAFVDYAFRKYPTYVRLEAIPFVHNTSSQGLLTKCGFTNEGLMRKFFDSGNGIMDCYMYSILREDWERLNT